MKHCIYIILLILFSGCNNQNKQKELQVREDSLNHREEALNIRERQLELREQQLAHLKEDTTVSKPDTLNSDLLGKWLVKMTCTETTCAGSAVGDSKTEQWEITADNGKVIARAMDGNILTRIYTGTYNGNTIELLHIRRKEGSQPEIKMIVRLRVMNGTLADGQREILRENDCKVVYALQLEKM